MKIESNTGPFDAQKEDDEIICPENLGYPSGSMRGGELNAFDPNTT